MVVLGIGCLNIDPFASPGARSASIVGYVLVAASLALDVRYALVIRGIVHGREWNTGALFVVAIILILHGQGKLNGPRKSKPTLTGQ